MRRGGKEAALSAAREAKPSAGPKGATPRDAMRPTRGDHGMRRGGKEAALSAAPGRLSAA
jgi:hypothetical protein